MRGCIFLSPEGNICLNIWQTYLKLTFSPKRTLKPFHLRSVPSTWFRNNQLTINFTKTCFSVFSNKSTKQIQTLTWDGKVIQRVEVARYLGIHVDEKLSWSQHVNYICKKIRKLGFVFRLLARYINHYQICQLFYAFVYPHIYYGIEVYGTCNKTTMQSL